MVPAVTQKQSIQTHVSIEAGDAASPAQLGSNESTPLLQRQQDDDGMPDGSSSSTQYSGNEFLKQRRFRRAMLLFFLVCFVVIAVGGMAEFIVSERKSASHNAATMSNATTTDFSDLVHVSDIGEYSVTYPRNLTTNDTFADLASLMLPVWLEASLMSLSVLTVDVDPAAVKGTRKCLLTTRDLLDVFSPVYSNRTSQWRDLRDQYKRGYELVGTFQDLDHGNVTYDATLWRERRTAVLQWKAAFVRYEGLHDAKVRSFLLNPKPRGCYHHKESHLFWSELIDDGDDDDDDTDTPDRPLPLPRGNDLATPSVQQLARVQLNHALKYLSSILAYDTVLSREHQLQYHNLRKEIRSFLDVYRLFGFVLFPNVDAADDRNFATAIDTLTESRQVLGNLNDHWEKLNLYREKKLHVEQQPVLEQQIAQLWNQFKEWSTRQHLAGAIQCLMDRMTMVGTSSTTTSSAPPRSSSSTSSAAEEKAEQTKMP